MNAGHRPGAEVEAEVFRDIADGGGRIGERVGELESDGRLGRSGHSVGVAVR